MSWGTEMLLKLFVLSVLVGQVPSEKPDDALTSLNAQWRPILERVATEYDLVRQTDDIHLKRENAPVYKWARPGALGGTYGDIYVWTNRGNAEAVACFWRAPNADGTFLVFHELHSLSPSVLISSRLGPHQWMTKEGLQRQPIPDAPAPASTAVGRLQQMRTFCRDFAAQSISAEDDRVELRLLPQPLFRYQSSSTDIVDGALFAFVCTIGTDPEIFLQLEARADTNGPKWHCSLARFSHQNLFVRYKDREIWKAIRDDANPLSHNAGRTYWLFNEPFDSTLLKTRGTD